MQHPDADIHQGKERQGAKLSCAVHCKEWKEDGLKSLAYESKATQKSGGEIGRGGKRTGTSHQFSSIAQLCLTLRAHELQHARLRCPLPPTVCSNSCPLS